MYIYKIKSELPLTEYAPTWNISIGHDTWPDSNKVDTIRKWLINNEDRIKESYPPLHDGSTGLGNDSVTSRFGEYNLFDFSNELPELNDLLTFMRKAYINFVHNDYTNKIDLAIVCWFNIVKDGQKIEEHSHCLDRDSYLSANMHLDNYPTKTIYRTPYLPVEEHAFENVKGGISIFPSYVPHKTTEYTSSSEPRVSIACDLRLPETFKFYPNNLNARDFMSKSIFENLISKN